MTRRDQPSARRAVVFLETTPRIQALMLGLASAGVSIYLLSVALFGNSTLSKASLGVAVLAVLAWMTSKLFNRANGSTPTAPRDSELLTTKSTVVDNSIIIPAFNRSNEVCDLVEQIVALIESEIPDQTSEIIVVDDGSTDSTAADVAALREAHSITINVVSQKNQGVASARNHGALEARGRVLIYIDSDCVPQSEWLTNISRSVVPGEVAYARVEGDRVPYYPLEVSPLGTKFPGASFAMYRDDYLRLGGMCELFGHHLEDSDFYIKCVEAGIGVNSVQDAVIWHPLRNRSIGEIWRNALLHSYDALLLRRHGQRSYRFLRNVFAGVNVGPFYGVTVMALVLLVDGVAASFISLSFDYVVPWLLLVLILCAVYIAGVLGCAIYLRVPLRLWPRYVSSVITYVIGSAFGRAMGSWKFRTLIV